MANAKDVVIIGETAEGALALISGELAAAGSRLAQALGGDLIGILAGNRLEPLAWDLIAAGADAVHVIESPLLQEPQPDPFLAAVTPLVQQLQPAVVLMGKTPLGRDVAPRLAFRLGSGLAQDCVGITVDQESGALVGIRPVYGGASLARIAVHSAPALATLRPKTFDSLPRDSSRQGWVVSHQVDLDPEIFPTRLVERVEEETTGVRLEDATVVIGGGRGLGSPEPFKLLEEMARLLGGTVGASRAACDAGWAPHSYQVGLTGKSINAELYITVGISGASQHLAGLSAVKNLVAINKDAHANIFKEARYGVVGTWENVLPSFFETVRELVRS